MTAADDAYAEAQRLIAEAKRTEAIRLSFDNETTRALTRLPPEIAELVALRSLILNWTRITDLTPIAALTGLTAL